MPDDKLTPEQFAQKIKVKYPQYADIDDSTLAKKILDKYPQYQDMVQSAPAPQQQLGFLGAPTEYVAQLNAAAPKINDIIQSKQFAAAVSADDAQKQKQQYADLNEKYQRGDISDEDFKKGQSQYISDAFASKDRQAQTLANVGNDEKSLRHFLSATSEKNPDLSPDIQASTYLLDSKDRAHEGNVDMIMDNVDKIKSGDLTYDPQTRQLVKPTGLLKSMYNQLGQRHQNVEDYEFYSNATPGQAVQHYMDQKNQENPDIPTEKGTETGWFGIPTGAIGDNVGNMIIPAAKGIIGSVAGPWGSRVLTAHEFAMMEWPKAFKEKFGELLDKGADPTTAYNEASRTANVNATIAGTVGGTIGAFDPEVAAGESGLLAGLKSQKGLYNIGEKLIQNIGKFAENKTPGGVVSAAIAGTGEGLKSINEGKDASSEKIMGAAKDMLILHFLMGALVPGENKNITEEAKSRIADGLSKLSPEDLKSEIEDMVNNTKVLKRSDATEIYNRVNAQRDLNEGIPEGVSDENKAKIQKLKDKRTELENQMDEDHPSYVDPALHPKIKEQIDGVKKENADGTTEGKDGIKEQIRQLSKATNEPIITPFKNPEEPLIDEDHTKSYARIGEVRMKNPINVGDDVQWTSQGADQFEEPRKVTKISDDGKYAFVEGSGTGIPIDQLNKPKENAVQEPQASSILQHSQEGTGVEGSERIGVESGEQGQEAAPESEGNSKEKQIKELKPKFEMKELTDDQKIGSKYGAYAAKKMHAALKTKFEELNKMADCLWS